MKNCPSCGSEAEEGARFCLECGHGFGDAPSAPDDPWRGRMVAGRFRLLDKLGEGGMGEVYRAEQLPMGRHVAVKVLRQSLADDPRQVERFKREAQAVSQLSHPNTIIVHDFGQDADGTLFIAMELLEGQPLADLMEGGRALPPARAVHIMSQVCGSLAEAHGRGMVHRDLKPENIFLSDRAHATDLVKVLDFGIAKVTQGARGDRLETLTHAGAIFGTPQYMAPEQIRGEDIDARADVYALGVVLYQMISGTLPFEASTVVEMLTKHLSAQPAPISRDNASAEDGEAYARLEAIALRALSKDPNQRQPSARAFLEDLMAAMPNVLMNPLTGVLPAAVLDSSTNLPPPVVDDAPAPARSRGGLYVVLAIAVAVAIGGLGWQFFLKGNGGSDLPPGTVGKALPAVVAQPADEGGDPAGEPEKTPESAAAEPAKAPESAAAEPEKAPDSAAEAPDPGSDPEPDEPERTLTDDEAKRIAAEEEAKGAAADQAAKAAEAEEKTKAAEEKAAKAASDKQAAEAGKAAAEEQKATALAEKAAAEQQKAAAEHDKAAALEKEATAKAAAAAAEAQRLAAEEAAADAKAKAATADADKKKAQDEAAAAKKAREAADATAAAEVKKKEAAEAKAAAEKKKKEEAEAKAGAEAKKKVEAEAKAKKAQEEAQALKAELAKIEAEKIAAANKAEEERIKKTEAAAKAKAAKAKKTVKAAFGNLQISGASGITIKIGGKMKGRTPMSRAIRLKAGSHSVEASKDGRSRRYTVRITGGGSTRLSVAP